MDDACVLRKEVIPSGEAGVNLPVNLKRLIWNAQQLFKIKPHKKIASGVRWDLAGNIMRSRNEIPCNCTMLLCL